MSDRPNRPNCSPAPRGRAEGRPRRGVLLAILFLIPLTACATKADVRDLRDEIRELNSRQEVLLRELQRQQESQRDSAMALSSEFQNHQARVAGQFRNLEDLILMVQELAGISQQEIAALRDRLDSPRRGLEVRDPFDGDQGMQGAEEGYEQAMNLLRRGSPTAARMGFEGVVEGFPNHPLAAESRYHLADMLVQEGQLEEAIEAFLRIGELHPDADRVPDAYYRVGILYRELGDNNEARRYLERVVNTWPDSGAADLARETLREIG